MEPPRRKEEGIPGGVRLGQHSDPTQQERPRQTIFSWLGRLELINVGFHRRVIELHYRRIITG